MLEEDLGGAKIHSICFRILNHAEKDELKVGVGGETIWRALRLIQSIPNLKLKSTFFKLS